MTSLQIYQFLCLEDNYCVLIHEPGSQSTAAIDAPDARAVMDALASRGWTLTHLFCTHHHVDHTAGVVDLKATFGCKVYGPRREASRIPAIDISLGEGDQIDFAGHKVDIIETPGHTLGHIAYHLPDQKLVFVADTLFPLGCGRVFEGTMEQMWWSLSKLMALPKDTVVYSGHEYTAANARFALTIEPENQALQRRSQEITQKRSNGEPTVPTTIGLELETNPFVRPNSPAIRARLGMVGHSDAEVFAEIRRRKDEF
ncbi:hydroxyacylglutathione hydrolase [Rhodoligotrophos defluvii]|uniref:hydroxyacylglutathione hydrolase n=1 Tax=Rhodoligotrophos defluvii TaxID=2561934 RepID=UPI0010C9439A|nr:hydroxyacylglutathione hydrolase [Rhodoligotrophos defluvii]